MDATSRSRLTNPKQTTMKYDNDETDDMLASAIIAKDLDKVRAAFKKGANPNGGEVCLPDWDGYHSNFYLTLKVFPEALPVFLENGLDLERPTHLADPLMDAIDAENPEAILKLFEAGAKDDCYWSYSDPEMSRCSAVYYAVYMERATSLHCLLENGYKSRDDENVLGLAIARKNKDIVRVLVDHGFALDPKEVKLYCLGDSFFHNSPAKLVEDLHDCFSLAKKTKKGSWASLCKEQAIDDIEEAIRKGRQVTLLTLLDDIEEVAIPNSFYLLASAIESNNIFAIKELVERGADINARGPAGMTPLFFLNGACREDTVDFLVNLGADINAKDDFGTSLLARIDRKMKRAKRVSGWDDYCVRMEDIARRLAELGAESTDKLKEQYRKRYEELKKEKEKNN